MAIFHDFTNNIAITIALDLLNGYTLRNFAPIVGQALSVWCKHYIQSIVSAIYFDDIYF